MQRTGKRTGGLGPMVAMTVAVFVSTLAVLSGCSIAGKPSLPANLESRLASDGTADDHMTAALFYQREAERARAEAAKYEARAAAIKPLEDTKGFRRNELNIAAEERRKHAAEMMQLSAVHQAKAQTLSGRRQQPQ